MTAGISKELCKSLFKQRQLTSNFLRNVASQIYILGKNNPVNIQL